MSSEDDPRRQDRRAFLTRAATLTALAASAPQGRAEASVLRPKDVEPFFGAHQGGIVTPIQRHVYFAAFDLSTERPEEVTELLRAWTAAAARMTVAEPAQPLAAPLQRVGRDVSAQKSAGAYEAGAQKFQPSVLSADTADALGLSPARLTVTFGFGSTLFVQDGRDRFGLAARRPAALIDLPKFPGDQLVEEHTGGDLSVQACAEDAQVAFHAVRQLARIADNVARIRWVQTGFLPNSPGHATPRNLMGFKDGTNNPPISDPAAMAKFVWVGDEGPNWMHGGTYLIARRIRIALEHWDRMNVAFQEQTLGREKYSGAPLGRKREFDSLNLDAADASGNPLIAENAHVRLAAAASNEGARILRRPYSYNDGVNFTTERWPPWRQGMEYDAGLFFLAYQRDPRTGFIKIYERMSRFDMLNQFVTHVGGGLFACPGGVRPGQFAGQGLFEST